jgi:hypothetical protein
MTHQARVWAVVEQLSADREQHAGANAAAGFVHQNTPMCRILIFKDNRTSGDVPGHAADVWGSKSHEFLSCPAATAMILPITDDLVPPIKAWVSLLIPS